MKYLRSTTLGCKDIGNRKSEFVGKTQFLGFSVVNRDGFKDQFQLKKKARETKQNFLLFIFKQGF